MLINFLHRDGYGESKSTHYGIFIPPIGCMTLVTMNVVPSVVHKCLKFIHEGTIHVVHNTSYKLSIVHGGYSLDHFWLAPVGLLPPRMDLLYQTYMKYMSGDIMPKVRYPPPYTISHRACLKANNDATLAQRREEKKHAQSYLSSSSTILPIAPSHFVVAPSSSTPRCLLDNSMVPAWCKPKHPTFKLPILPTMPQPV